MSTGVSSDNQDSVVPWWRRAVVYQIYPRSFADANGDGTGDVEGIRSRLPYLKTLGIDAIWISPWYPSPLKDGGYDVADFRDIAPRFGTLAHAESLIADAHALNIRVIVDLVPNHTSSDHIWFQTALAAGPGSVERERYIFRSGQGDGSEPPNNWTSVFGGPAWQRVDDGEWYLHLFDPSQPDLNWDNEEVRAEFDDIFRFWLDRGVDGFRIDVAHGLAKDPALPDVDSQASILEVMEQSADHSAQHPHWDRDEVHDIIRRWRKILDNCGREVMMIAEAWVDPNRIPLYLRPDEYHQSFNFDFLNAPWKIEDIRIAIDRGIQAAAEVGSTSTWTLSNHDVMRHCTRKGLAPETNWYTWPLEGPSEALDSELGLRRARAATLMLLALPGSTYIYQGEELGLPEVWDLPIEVLDDPLWENSGRTIKGRDGCRVPIPWKPDGPSYGFGEAKPWLPQPAIYGELSVQLQSETEDSTLALYRKAIALRKELLTRDESFEWVDLGSDILAFRRSSGIFCIVNFGMDSITLPEGKVLVASQEVVDNFLQSDCTAWIHSPTD